LPLPNFDIRNYPFFLHRNKEGLNLINLKTGLMNLLLKRQNNSSSFEKTLIVQDKEEDCLRIVMSTKNAAIEEIKVSNSFFTNLRDLNVKS
jgi:hypothetical protein